MNATSTTDHRTGKGKVLENSPRSTYYFFLFLVLFFFVSSTNVQAATGLESGAMKPATLIIIGCFTLFFFLVGLSTDTPYFVLVGTVLLFLIGFFINSGNVYIPSGNELTNTTFDAATNTTFTNTTAVYEAWDTTNNHLVGWLIMFVSFVFFALTLFGLRGEEY